MDSRRLRVRLVRTGTLLVLIVAFTAGLYGLVQASDGLRFPTVPAAPSGVSDEAPGAMDPPPTQARGPALVAPAVSAPTAREAGLRAVLADSLLDADGDGEVNPGDRLRYIVEVANTGSTDLLGVLFTGTHDPNVALVAGGVRVAPVAGNDVRTAVSGQEGGDSAPGLLGNDASGVPAAAVVSFGGGSLAASDATSHPAGATVSPLPGFPDGSLTVNADGSYSFTSPVGFVGVFSFEYRVENEAGHSTATVEIRSSRWRRGSSPSLAMEARPRSA